MDKLISIEFDKYHIIRNEVTFIIPDSPGFPFVSSVSGKCWISCSPTKGCKSLNGMSNFISLSCHNSTIPFLQKNNQFFRIGLKYFFLKLLKLSLASTQLIKIINTNQRIAKRSPAFIQKSGRDKGDSFSILKKNMKIEIIERNGFIGSKSQ